MKTYSLGSNSYSQIIVEAYGYIEHTATRDNLGASFSIDIGAATSPTTRIADIGENGDQALAYSIFFGTTSTSAVTINVDVAWIVGDYSWYCNGIMVYGIT